MRNTITVLTSARGLKSRRRHQPNVARAGGAQRLHPVLEHTSIDTCSSLARTTTLCTYNTRYLTVFAALSDTVTRHHVISFMCKLRACVVLFRDETIVPLTEECLSHLCYRATEPYKLPASRHVYECDVPRTIHMYNTWRRVCSVINGGCWLDFDTSWMTKRAEIQIGNILHEHIQVVIVIHQRAIAGYMWCK